MRAARSRNAFALALSSLALVLALWWAWDTFFGEDEASVAARAAAVPADWLDEPPAPRPPVPTPPTAASGRPAPPPAPPPLPPRIVPRTEAARAEATPPAPPAEAADVGVLPSHHEPRSSEFASDAWRDTLLGGVARTSSRATLEVAVPQGRGWIGTPTRWVDGLLEARGAQAFPLLETEAPRHVEQFPDFLIDRYEVRNHDWLLYLNRTARVVYLTSEQPDRTLPEIVEALVPERPSNPDVLDVAARQLFEANKPALLGAFKSRVVTGRNGVVDEDATYARIRDRAVPRGVRLVFYDRLPPGTWPGAVYADGRVDHPVRDVSLEEALAYAVYRGRFLPTEQQWEYAARGPQGLDYPWDDSGVDFATHVNGGLPRRQGVLPDTHPVAFHGGGASWIGCFNMLGNVSEWTGSVLAPYPGAAPFSDELRRLRLPVVRGGSAFEQDRLAVRPALRGWSGDDPDGAPRARWRRVWTGLRTARYEDAARSRLPVMRLRAALALDIDPTLLEEDRYQGVEGVQDRAFERVVGHDEVPKPPAGAKALVAQPLRVVARPGLGPGRYVANTQEGVEDPATLLGVSTAAPVLLALWHSDLTVQDVYADARAEAFFGGAAPAPRLRRTAMPPGTRFVALWRGLVAFIATDFSAAWYPSSRPPPPGVLGVLPRGYPPDTVRRPEVSLVVRSKRADLDLMVPLHATEEPGRAVPLALRLGLDPREMELVAGWQEGRETR